MPLAAQSTMLLSAGSGARIQVMPGASLSVPVVIDAGRWDGVGVRSTGLVGSYPPVLVTLRQTFTKAGTYPYRCLFHPAMAGAVKVG